MAYILGLDVSHWNTVDWPSWAARGYKFAWIKATEGTGWTDPKYGEHRTAALAAGFKVGAYHYFRGAMDGSDQAEFFRAVAGDNILPPVIDVESFNNTGIAQATFASRLQECVGSVSSLFGRKPVIYTSRSKWSLLVGSAPQIASECDLWVAHYTLALAPLLPLDWADWAVWQYTSSPLDQNRMRQEFWDTIVPPSGEVTLKLERATFDKLKAAINSIP